MNDRPKRTITREQHMALVGAQFFGERHSRALDELARQVAIIIGEDPKHGPGHSSDFVCGAYYRTIDSLLDVCNIDVVDTPPAESPAGTSVDDELLREVEDYLDLQDQAQTDGASAEQLEQNEARIRQLIARKRGGA